MSRPQKYHPPLLVPFNEALMKIADGKGMKKKKSGKKKKGK